MCIRDRLCIAGHLPANSEGGGRRGSRQGADGIDWCINILHKFKQLCNLAYVILQRFLKLAATHSFPLALTVYYKSAIIQLTIIFRIMCILRSPRPIYRSTYRPTRDRCIGRHIDRCSTDMSVDISTDISTEIWTEWWSTLRPTTDMSTDTSRSIYRPTVRAS